MPRHDRTPGELPGLGGFAPAVRTPFLAGAARPLTVTSAFDLPLLSLRPSPQVRLSGASPRPRILPDLLAEIELSWTSDLGELFGLGPTPRTTRVRRACGLQEIAGTGPIGRPGSVLTARCRASSRWPLQDTYGQTFGSSLGPGLALLAPGFAGGHGPFGPGQDFWRFRFSGCSDIPNPVFWKTGLEPKKKTKNRTERKNTRSS